MERNKDSKGEEIKELLLVTHGGKEIDFENLPMPKTKGTKQLNDNHRKLALLQATAPYHNMTFTEQCELVGIARNSGYKALRKPEFQAYVEEILDSRNRAFMGVVYSRLQGIIENSRSDKMVLEGIKIYLQMTGKLKETHEHTHEIKKETTLKDLEAEVLEMEKEIKFIDGDHNE
ncbi:phBC6A51 family helix-turn-helix protein [Peribacillus sp. YIM B13477]|uniref:phBC6A51 family helix-turn-helix protein n=1 Tax=Peribacillus sp. YIM B13477 TaxID=3366300 RepID=UPI0036729E60